MKVLLIPDKFKGSLSAKGVISAIEKGIKTYGSPTTSDQAIIPFPSVKLGPGDSSRSHTADEFILKSEVFKGIELYIDLLENLEI